MSQDDGSSANGSHAPYLAKNNIMSMVSSPQYQQIQPNIHGSKIVSRERNGRIVLNNAGSRNYGVGTQNNNAR
jgi:PBP1b-binding outer membrane lipoprotein LpoB